MTDFHDKFSKGAKEIRLTEAERARLRATLHARMQSDVPPAVMRSPYVFHFPRMAAGALLVVLLLSGGTAYAAQGALPGDVLYSVKTEVVEPLQGALAFSDEAKLAWHTSVADTRLAEAEALAAQGTLDTTTGDALATNFTAHAKAAGELALKTTKDEATPDASETSTIPERVLQGGEAIIAAAKESKNEVALRASGAFVRNITQDIGSEEVLPSRVAIAMPAPQVAPSAKEAPMSLSKAAAPSMKMQTFAVESTAEDVEPAQEERMVQEAPMNASSTEDRKDTEESTDPSVRSEAAHAAVTAFAGKRTAETLRTRGTLLRAKKLLLQGDAALALGSTTEALDAFDAAITEVNAAPEAEAGEDK